MGVDDELKKLSDFLKIPANRDAFCGQGHARPAMTNAGIDWNGFPPNFIDTLEAIQPNDMKLISDANVKLRGNLSAAEKSKIVQFPV